MAQTRKGISIQIGEDEIKALRETIGEIIKNAVQEEVSKLRTALLEQIKQPPQTQTPSTTGVFLSQEDRQKAARTKEAIEDRSIERPGLIDTKQAAALLSISPRTLWRLTTEKSMPQPVRPGGRLVRWYKPELVAWIEDGCPSMRHWESTRKEALARHKARFPRSRMGL